LLAGEQIYMRKVLLLVLFRLPNATESCGVVRKTCSGASVVLFMASGRVCTCSWKHCLRVGV